MVIRPKPHPLSVCDSCVRPTQSIDQNFQHRISTRCFCSTTMLPSSGMLSAEGEGMSDNSLEKRVAILEMMMAGKTLEEHFREHAELIDRRFAEVHGEF